MKRSGGPLLTSLFLLLLAACIGDDDPLGTGSPYPPDPPSEPVERPVEPKEPPIVFNGNTTEPIETDTTYYALREDGVGLATEIWFRFENQAADTLYIVNCNRWLAPILEKQVDEGWENFWGPFSDACLGAPIVIPPGGELVDLLPFWEALPGHNFSPELPSGDVGGVYRLVISHVVFHYDEDLPGFGDPVPLEYQVSNSFFLDDPRR
jgi:hypothetical protein